MHPPSPCHAHRMDSDTTQTPHMRAAERHRPQWSTVSMTVPGPGLTCPTPDKGLRKCCWTPRRCMRIGLGNILSGCRGSCWRSNRCMAGRHKAGVMGADQRDDQGDWYPWKLDRSQTSSTSSTPTSHSLKDMGISSKLGLPGEF